MADGRSVNRSRDFMVLTGYLFLPRNPLLVFNRCRVGLTDAGDRATEGWVTICWFVVRRVAPMPVLVSRR
jgi:hypothetical protein